MRCFRITKYNPINRNELGKFTADDWTSVYDVGKVYLGSKLTFEKYLFYEEMYIEVIKIIMESNAQTLRIEDLEKNEYTHFSDLFASGMQKSYNSIENENEISLNNIDLIARSILREIIWCKLVSKSMFVHFGYDLYMYIGCENFPCEKLESFKEKGLFFEEMDSPYLDLEQ